MTTDGASPPGVGVPPQTEKPFAEKGAERPGLCEVIAERYRAWRRSRYWTAEAQLDFLRVRMREDHRWLASAPIAAELCERYLAMLSKDWYHRPHEPVDAFRDRIGLQPSAASYTQAPAPRAAEVRLVPAYEQWRRERGLSVGEDASR
jgi:hypothetical protein